MASAEAARVSPSEAEMTDVTEDGDKSTKPTCIIVLGMAGSGKTTFVQVEI